MIINQEGFYGKQDINPYEFRRSWTTKKAVTNNTVDNFQEAMDYSQEENTTCYIKSIKLSVNGLVLDSLHGKGSRDSCMVEFFRLNKYTGMSIDYKDFKESKYIAAFNLSTSNTSGMDFLVPSIRAGQVRVDIVFNEPIQEGVSLALLSYAEYPSMLTINAARNVSNSFVGQ